MLDTLKLLLEDKSFKSQVKHSTKIFKANEKILKEGKLHPYLYIIKKGSVRVFVSGETGEKTALHPGVADLNPDDIFGEFGIFDDAPASADVAAVTETEVVEIDIKSFRAFLDANPQIGYKLMRELLQIFIERLRHANQAVIRLFTYGIKAHKLDKYLE